MVRELNIQMAVAQRGRLNVVALWMPIRYMLLREERSSLFSDIDRDFKQVVQMCGVNISEQGVLNYGHNQLIGCLLRSGHFAVRGLAVCPAQRFYLSSPSGAIYIDTVELQALTWNVILLSGWPPA